MAAEPKPVEKMIEAGSVRSLSEPISPLYITYATVIKGLHVARRYVPNLIGSFVGLAVRIVFFLLIANAATFSNSQEGTITGRDLFLFFQGALLLLVFNGPTLWGPIQAVTADLYNGTLEYLYSNPGSRYAYYIGTVLSEVVISMVVFIPFYIFLVFTSRTGPFNMFMILLVCCVTLVVLTAMGVMIALLALLWRQVTSIANVLGMLFEFLGGAYLPVSSFPQPLQWLAFLIPYTWGYDLIRYYSFGGDWETLAPVWLEWIILGVFAVVFTVLSRDLLQRSERRAKRYGLHII